MTSEETSLTEAFEYLDELRESGRTNMMAGAQYLQIECGWDRAEARKAHAAWMTTFSRDLSVAERVAKAAASS
jgi:uncharacterized protein with beta-barrel porin domain